jgi:hypothetical protein
VAVALIDIVDETWIAAPRERVAAAVADAANWRRWWPDLDLAVAELRGLKGVRWRVADRATPVADRLRGAPRRTAGTMEVWLEPYHGGVLLHYFLRLDDSDRRPRGPRARQRVVRMHRRRAKRVFWALQDDLEGEPRPVPRPRRR